MIRHTLFSLSPLKITAIYLVFGIVWIVTTDWVVITLFDSPETISLLQTLKGWIFVVLSSALILGMTQLRANQVELAREKLERASQQLQVLHRFLRHNLRNNLTVTRGNIELVEAQLKDSREQSRLATARKTVDEIAKTSEKMRVVDRVDITQASTENDVDLVEVTHGEIKSIREDYPAITISFDAPNNAPIQGNSTLSHAIYELLENAVTHNSNPQGQCMINVTIQRKNGAVVLTIEDNGPGIHDSELKALRAEGETDLIHMSGVGLWLSTWLTEYFGGHLAFESQKEEGTVVKMTFKSVTSIESVGEISQGFTGLRASV